MTLQAKHGWDHWAFVKLQPKVQGGLLAKHMTVPVSSLFEGKNDSRTKLG